MLVLGVFNDAERPSPGEARPSLGARLLMGAWSMDVDEAVRETSEDSS
jgi:hypothetical protein